MKGTGAWFPVLVRHRRCAAATAPSCTASKGLWQKASNKGSLQQGVLPAIWAVSSHLIYSDWKSLGAAIPRDEAELQPKDVCPQYKRFSLHNIAEILALLSVKKLDKKVIPCPHPFYRADSEILSGLLDSPFPFFIYPSLVWELNCYTVILFCIKEYFFFGFIVSGLGITLWNYFTILLKSCSIQSSTIWERKLNKN